MLRAPRLFALAAIAAVGAVACSKQPADDGIVGGLSTDGRMHVYNTSLALEKSTSGGLHTRTFQGDGFVYVAAVDAPKNPVSGSTVQATNFAFSGNYAYVVYNTAGEELGGALEVVDLTDVEHPVLVGSIVFTRSEFADVRVVGPYAILTGQRVENGVTGASMSILDISVPSAPAFLSSIPLPGHYATSLAIDGHTAWVTTGDDGALVTVDITTPTAPVVSHVTPLPNATNVVRHYQQTFVLGGNPAQIFAVADDQSLHSMSTPLAAGPLAAPSRMVTWNNAIYTNAGSTSLRRLPLGDGTFGVLSSLEGTSNGIDVTSRVAVLAQGEKGTSLFDVSDSANVTSLGSFAFPDERGSANQVRFGSLGGTGYVFLGDGLGGFRIVKTAFAVGDDPAACTTPWWTAGDAAEWWAAPASSSEASTIGTWTAAGDSTEKCLVEDFRPSFSNSGCDSLGLRRVRAIGPQPNEGQVCALSCPAGMVIANAHTRYGEASPLNAGGDYTCTGTTTPALHEITCDVMSAACNDGGQSSCSVRYHNEYCGDPWYYCIKNGRTKYQCVPAHSP